MAATYIGDLKLQYLINCKQEMAQNDSPKPIHRESIFIGMLSCRSIEWRILRFDCEILLKNESITNQELRSHCKTCPGKVERSNTSDWSILHRMPERDHLVKPNRV